MPLHLLAYFTYTLLRVRLYCLEMLTLPRQSFQLVKDILLAH
jgi:hypothetical protein